jgi:hypothetical protein
MTWDEKARTEAREAAAKREPGFYWIKRNEPDGWSGWEPAQFVKWGELPDERPGWYCCGQSHRQYEVAKPFSNAWVIGPRVEPPA